MAVNLKVVRSMHGNGKLTPQLCEDSVIGGQ